MSVPKSFLRLYESFAITSSSNFSVILGQQAIFSDIFSNTIYFLMQYIYPYNFPYNIINYTR